MKKILFLISTLNGGGAEKVAGILCNNFYKNGYDVELMVTSINVKDAILPDINKDITVTSLKELADKNKSIVKHIIGSFACSAFEKTGFQAPTLFSKLSFDSEYGHLVSALQKKLANEPDTIVIAFLQPSIPIALIATSNLPNKVIFSERADPYRIMKHRYGKKFVKKYYNRANAVVFQTDDAKKVYPDIISKKGIVIENPINVSAITEYHGERTKNITTFCRISKQKNLPMLIKAFSSVHASHPDYYLRIIGDSFNDEGDLVLKQIKSQINQYNLQNNVILEPFKKNVINYIYKDAIYVNSSDYEGISNAMLEAMACGMPCVCTDCPIGGAKQTIEDGVNGLLTPVNDDKSLAECINKIIETPKLADKLSNEASKIKNKLSEEAIAAKWLELIENS